MEDYYQQAKRIHAENQQKEIARIAEELKEKEALKKQKEIQDRCPHEKTHSYNHGYHTICQDCGAEV